MAFVSSGDLRTGAATAAGVAVARRRLTPAAAARLRGRLLGAGPAGWAFRDAERRLTVVAAGEAFARRVAGPGRFAALERARSEVREVLNNAHPGLDDAPVLQVGATFDAGPGAPGSPWEGWPRAVLRLPRVALVAGDAGAVAWRFAAPDAAASRPVGVAADAGPGEDPSAWARRVQAALGAIAAGRLSKVVLARAVRRDLPAGQRWDAARSWARLARVHPGAAAFLWREGGAAFVGATPEVLLRLRGAALETVALAGTAGRGADPAEDARLGAALLASDKERREHAAPVAAIEAALAAGGARGVRTGAARLRRLTHVQHLETPIRAERGREGLLELAGRLHPTPATGGTPREPALAWLAAHERLERGAYAAPLGWLTPAGDGALVVALRSALFRGGSAWSFAGAGIVAGSDPAAEWAETELKLRAVAAGLVAVPDPAREEVAR